MSRRRPLLLASFVLPLLAGCDLLGIEAPDKIAARKDAEGRAVGGACRQAGRAIEDCYALHPKADKAAVFAGWREMNDYMRENKMEEVAPQIAHPQARRSMETAEAAEADPPPKKRRAE